MRKKRTWIAILLSVLLVLPLLQGCRQKTPEEIFESAVANMDKLDSVHMNMTMELGIRFMDQKTRYVIILDADMIYEPFMGSAHVQMKMGGMGVEMQTYYEEIDGESIVYMGMDKGAGIQWYREKDKADSLKNGIFTMSMLEDITCIDEQNKRDENLLHYRVWIDAKEMQPLIESAASGEFFPVSDNQDAIMEEVFEEFGRVEMFFTVDRKSERVVKVEIELGAITNAIMQRSVEDSIDAAPDVDLLSLITLDELPVTVEYSRYNEIETIEIPEEARDGIWIDQDEIPGANT
ncbi:MAG: DUF6612 family protein [Candidatus Aphodomorpha sp.]